MKNNTQKPDQRQNDGFNNADSQKDNSVKQNSKEQDDMNAEILLTMQEFEDRLDNVNCSEEVK